MHAPSSQPSQWPDRPPDLLRDISGCLLEAPEFVPFHAVCKPWRDTATTTTRKQPLLPWLLAPDKMNPFSVFLKLRCVFSRTSYRALPPFSVRPRARSSVASADGTAAWYYTEHSSPSLRDLLTGAITLLLPPLPREKGRWWEGSPSGIVYSDGTVFLRCISFHGDTTKFRVALLRPGDATWMVIERTFSYSDLEDLYVSYYHGKMLITVKGPVPDDKAGIGDVLALARPRMPCELDEYFHVQFFVVESRGELLCLSIYVNQDYPHAFGGNASVPGLVRALSVSVHTLEENEAATEKLRWVRKDGGSLSDRVFFLGYPNSFAMEASWLSGDPVSSGCAYFVYEDLEALPNKPCYLFSYNLVDNKAKFVEQLPQGWAGDICNWLFPQPSIAPVEELIESRKWWKKKPHMAPTPRSNIYNEKPQSKCYNPYFRVLVGNLPLNVDRFRLQHFFSKHGKVSNSKIICKRNNKMAKKFGIVMIATVEEQ